jgi:hypothetical protein
LGIGERGVRSIPRPELRQYGRNVVAYCADGYPELGRDLLVGQTAADPDQDFSLTPCECRAGFRMATWKTRPAYDEWLFVLHRGSLSPE